jgi:hypothetical protein
MKFYKFSWKIYYVFYRTALHSDLLSLFRGVILTVKFTTSFLTGRPDPLLFVAKQKPFGGVYSSLAE